MRQRKIQGICAVPNTAALRLAASRNHAAQEVALPRIRDGAAIVGPARVTVCIGIPSRLALTGQRAIIRGVPLTEVKPIVPFLAVPLAALPLLAADPNAKDEVATAAKALAGKASYSWKSTVVVPESARFKPGPTEGNTEKEGFTSSVN
jgi:hypothetical protein